MPPWNMQEVTTQAQKSDRFAEHESRRFPRLPAFLVRGSPGFSYLAAAAGFDVPERDLILSRACIHERRLRRRGGAIHRQIEALRRLQPQT
jgi:hypothetical protein